MAKGCVCEKEYFRIAHNDEKLRVTSIHKDWSEYQVNVEVAQILRPRFRQDRMTAKMENSELEEYEVPDEFMLTPDGRAYWKGYGRYMGELNSRTQNLTPDQYNPEEDYVTNAIESAMRQGARTIITAYPRPKNDIGDVLVISFDPVANKGKMKVVNTAIDGETHKQHEAVSMVAKRYENTNTHRLKNSLLFVTDKNLASEAQPIRQRYTGRVLEHGTIPAIAETIFQTPYRVTRDVASTAISTGVFVMEALRRRRVQWQSQEKETKDARFSAEKPKKEKKLLSTRKKEKYIKRTLPVFRAIHFAVETGTGLGGALYMMHAILRKEKHKENLTLTERRNQRARIQSKENKRKKKVKIEGITFSKKKETKRKTIYEFITRKITQRKEKAILKKRKTILVERLTELKATMNKQKIKEVWKALVKLAKRITAERRLSASTEKRKRKEVEKQLVARFAFAWMIRIVTKKYFHLSIDRSANKKKECLIKREPSRWILLAIIWHLNAIREHGKPVVYKKQKKKQTKPLVLPKQAVIFAFAS